MNRTSSTVLPIEGKDGKAPMRSLCGGSAALLSIENRQSTIHVGDDGLVNRKTTRHAAVSLLGVLLLTVPASAQPEGRGRLTEAKGFPIAKGFSIAKGFPIATGFPIAKGFPIAATDDEVAALISDLGDIAYEQRTLAMRRLSAIGMPAVRRLRTAAEGDDAEIALRARSILAEFDRVLFAGVDVDLAFSRPRRRHRVASPRRLAVAWDEPVDLIVTLTNRGEFPAKVPFEITRTTGRQSRFPVAATDDARQVGDMLDVAEWLTVRKIDGSEIPLRVDDTAADFAVEAALKERLGGGSIHVLRPGESVTLTVRAFNRGWARYPLLDPGTYVAVLEYVPAWRDHALTEQRVGRVVSNEARITVTGGAPKTVSRMGVEASIAIHRDGLFLVAQLINRTDQEMFVNLNFAGSVPFARGRWVWELDGKRREVPVITARGNSWHDFDAVRLVKARPGGSVELARISLAELLAALKSLGAGVEGDRWTVHFDYLNLCGRRWQLRRGAELIGNTKAPKVFQTPLPRRILASRHTSNMLTAPRAD